MARETVTSLTGEQFQVHVENGRLRIAGARTIFENVIGSNGVLHRFIPCCAPKTRPARPTPGRVARKHNPTERSLPRF